MPKTCKGAAQLRHSRLSRFPPSVYSRLLLTSCLLFGLLVVADAQTNHAAGKTTVSVGNVVAGYSSAMAVDGVVSDASRWLVNGPVNGELWLEVQIGASVSLAQAHIYSGYQGSGSTDPAFHLEYWNGSAWATIPGTTVTGNTSQALVVTFISPVTTDRIRYVPDGAGLTGHHRLREITLWSQSTPLFTGIDGIVLPSEIPVCLNQIGFQIGAPKRFTAPTVADGTPFTVVRSSDPGVPLYTGVVTGGLGDLSSFEPAQVGPYVVNVHPTESTSGWSDAFLIHPRLIQEKYVPAAVHFMTDARSGSGTHASAFGGCPWRDGTYYSFEIPSLIHLLLTARQDVLAMPREIDWEAEKARVLSPTFNFIATTEDEGFLEALRRYYQNYEPPAPDAPDLVKVVHFGLGVTLERPSTRDWSGDERVRMIHAQTVEWCAWFLHAWPVLRDWLPDSFYVKVRDFAFAQWGATAGLGDGTKTNDDPSSLEIDPLWHPSTYGTVDKHPFKGRHAPGHSIWPNLLMHEVALREGRANAAIYLQAARTQTEYLMANVDWTNPKTTKGHRMSECKTMPGLSYFLRHHPQQAPPGLAAKIEQWADIAISRSGNLWDFRRYEYPNDTNGDGVSDWSLPRESAKWNEPGNLAGFPACALAAAWTLDHAPQKQKRLREISWAAIDCLFGRNPLRVASPGRPHLGFPDVERGWPVLWSGRAAYLDAARGALCSGPATSHFPYNPNGEMRHHEPWTNFNASWNVSLAWMLADLDGTREAQSAPLGVVISELLAAPASNAAAEFIELYNPTDAAVRLAGLKLTGAIGYNFSSNAPALGAGARCVLARDLTAFHAVHGSSISAAGVYTGALPDAGGEVRLEDVNGNTFARVAWALADAYPDHSVVFRGGPSDPSRLDRRSSGIAAGRPGQSDSSVLTLPPLDDENSNGIANLIEHAVAGLGAATPTLQIHRGATETLARGYRHLEADDTDLIVEWSTDLSQWQNAILDPTADAPTGLGTVQRTWRIPSTAETIFARYKATHRR